MENRKEIAKELSKQESLLADMHLVLRNLQKQLGPDGYDALDNAIENLLDARGYMCDLIDALKGGNA